MYKVKIEKFEGPLDLLLQLIESTDLDITEVSIAQVADQFMHYLGMVEEKNPEELADFLVVASKLLLIKSRVLLPSLNLDEDQEVTELENQLKIYKEYHEASKKVEQMLLDKNFLFSREKIPVDVEVIFNPPQNLTTDKIKKIFMGVIKEIEPIVRLPKKSMLRAVSIKEKIKELSDKILQSLSLNFSELITSSKDKTEIIVTFLGVLELVKQRTVVVKQDNMFEEISISRFENNDNLI